MIAFSFFYQMGGMIKNVSQLHFCQAMFADASGNYTVANMLDRDPNAKVEPIKDREILKKFNEMRVRNGKSELNL